MSLADEVRARRGDPDDPFDQGAARTDYVRAARKRDRANGRAYNAGHRGEHRHQFDGDDELLGHYDEGATDAKNGTRRTSKRSGARKLFAKPIGQAQRAGVNVVSDGAGLLVGALAYALLINYIKGGTPQVRGWLAAKFINKPYTQAPPVAPAAPATPQVPGVQPGSQYYPPNPNGGLPSKPPLGSTPPAGYS